MPPVAQALLEPLTRPDSRTWWVGLVVAAVVAGLFALRTRPSWTWAGTWAVLRHRSSVLDLQLYLGGQLLTALRGTASVSAAWWLATHGVRQADAWFGTPEPSAWPLWVLTGLYTAVLFVAWDLSRFLLHWLSHRVPALWALHQVHHSAQVLTPLTFHRIHPVESLLYELRGVLVSGGVAALFFWGFRGAAVDWTLFGVAGVGLVLNVVFGNLRHSHVWLRFPAWLETWFISPAQHQLHHSRDPGDHGCNLGTWLAIWDRLAGTLTGNAKQFHKYEHDQVTQPIVMVANAAAT